MYATYFLLLLTYKINYILDLVTPVTPPPSTPNNDDAIAVCKTVEGEKCIFPFQYKEITFK